MFYGWVVVAACFIIGTVIFGIYFSFGVFFKSIEAEFDLPRAAVSAILSVQMVLGILFTIAGGWASDRYGPRMVFLLMGLFTGLSLVLTSRVDAFWQLFITYSLLLSMGANATYVVLTSTVSHWFAAKRGLALGIAGSGVGLGAMVVPLLATFLISALDWRAAYLVIGLLAWAIVLPLSRLLRKEPADIGAQPDGASFQSSVETGQPGIEDTLPYLSLPQAWRTRSFWMVMFIWLFFAGNAFLVFTHIVPHATDMGISREGAATVLSIIGGVGIAGRIFMGGVSDRMGRKSALVMSTLVQAGAMVWLVWAQSLWALYVFAVVYGFTYGGINSTASALICDAFGLARIGAILGVLDIGFGLGGAIGPALGGLVFDARGDYQMAFWLGAASMLIVTWLVVLIRREVGRQI
ncbi:MAG: MFS transporter [Chloroflexi bacterium]|nr:MFS transporter [Chloroflexota bacterium]